MVEELGLSFSEIFVPILVSLLTLLCELGPRLEKKMATHSSILAWEIPWTEEPSTVYWVTKESDLMTKQQ